jgi:hypothetical protein
LTDHYDINDIDSLRSHLVYLTWKYNTSNLYIPSIIEGVNDYSNKCYLSAGKSRYIINAVDKLTGPSIGTTSSTKIHLSFDMSKDWPPTEIEWNFERTPESISFSGKDVRIYTDFQFTVNGISTNCITVNGEAASGINFEDYIGDLRKVNSILLTPFNAASTGSYKAYKLTFENTDIYEYANELDVIQNKLLTQMAEFEAGADNKYLAKDTKFSWSDIGDTPEIPEFSFKDDTVVIKKGDSSFTLPTNIQTAIQSEVNLSLKSQDFITKDTLTMMGGLNSSNPGLSYDDTETVVQLLNKQSEGYVITDFCNIIVKYLDGNVEVAPEKYLQWPIKGNVIRGVYHPAKSNGTLSMSVAVVAKSEISINEIDVNVTKITIDGRDPMFGLGCSYGNTKTVPWEVKLENSDYNFKTSISGYLTLTYEAL